MDWVISFLSGLLLGLLTNYFSPPFRRFTDSCFTWLFHLMNPNRFDLTGKWRQTFKEPSPEDPEQWREVQEVIELKHLGNAVSATGQTEDDHRHFKYECRVEHNLVFGSYVKTGERGSICGKGMIQLVVRPDRLSMKGQATWFDRDTEQIESSETIWTKV